MANMGTVFLQICMVMVYVWGLYAVQRIAKKNPTQIPGFKWGVSAQEIAADKRWLKTFQRWTTLNRWITLMAGILTACLCNRYLYLLGLLLPTLVVVTYLSVTQPRGGMRM